MPRPHGFNPSLANPKMQPIIRPTIYDIHVAAGFWIADGSCSHNKYGRTMVQVGQVERKVPDWFKDRFGGAVYTVEAIHTSFRKKPHYVWNLSGPRAVGFLLTIYSIVVSLSDHKIEQIERILAAWRLSIGVARAKEGRKQERERLRLLAQRTRLLRFLVPERQLIIEDTLEDLDI